MKLAVVVWFYVPGIAYFSGFAHAEGAKAREMFLPIAWLPLLVYGAVWGARSRRRWYCWLRGHKWRDTTRGIDMTTGETLPGRQCTRCYLSEDVEKASVFQGTADSETRNDG